MANIFISSDLHINHRNILTFLNPDGSRMRPFDSVEQMDEFMLEEHNSVVKPNDKWYNLGDVAIKRKDIAKIASYHGKKRLIRGNHDIYKTREYLEVFEEVYAYRVLDDLLLSHIPVHPESVKPRWTNVHGHTHSNVPQGHFGPQYYNVCVEMINYRPVALEDLRVLIRKQREDYLDLLAAREALKEPGRVPFEDVKSELGL